MNNGCIEVCDIVCDRLSGLGIDIKPENEDHEPIFDGLEQVTFIKDTDFEEMKRAIFSLHFCLCTFSPSVPREKQIWTSYDQSARELGAKILTRLGLETK